MAQGAFEQAQEGGDDDRVARFHLVSGVADQLGQEQGGGTVMEHPQPCVLFAVTLRRGPQAYLITGRGLGSRGTFRAGS